MYYEEIDKAVDLWKDKLGRDYIDTNAFDEFLVYERVKYQTMPLSVLEILLLADDIKIQCNAGWLSMCEVLDHTSGWIQEDMIMSIYKANDLKTNRQEPLARRPEKIPQKLVCDTRYAMRIGTGQAHSHRCEEFTVKGELYQVYYGIVEVEIEKDLKDGIIFQWELRTKGQAFRGDLVSSTSYTSSMHTYYKGLHDKHRRMYETILSSIPPDTIIVAPADGLGAISEIWEGQVKAGDMVITPHTQPRVCQETITQTLQRACKGDLIFLGYCSVFLTELDRQILSKHEGQVIVVDSHFYNIGRSDLTYNVEHLQWYGGSPLLQELVPPEKVSIAPKPAYSDALISHRRPIRCLDWGATCEWVRRAVYSVEVVADKDANLPFLPEPRGGVDYLAVAHNIETVLSKKGPMFFVQVGRVVSAYTLLETLDDLTALESRSLYAVAHTVPNEQVLKSMKVHYHVDTYDSVILFWTVSPESVHEWETFWGTGQITFSERQVYHFVVQDDLFTIPSAKIELARTSVPTHLGMLLKFAPHYDRRLVDAYGKWLGVASEVERVGIDAQTWRQAVKSSSTCAAHSKHKASGADIKRYRKIGKKKK